MDETEEIEREDELSDIKDRLELDDPRDEVELDTNDLSEETGEDSNELNELDSNELKIKDDDTRLLDRNECEDELRDNKDWLELNDELQQPQPGIIYWPGLRLKELIGCVRSL